jgi:pyruvate ferredoxin oxidoreductase beta subunit
MNTGIQRSGATPRCASTTTAPSGSQSAGKPQFRKDLTAIVAAHDIPYAAQATIGYWSDLVRKAEKAFHTEGPAFLNVLAPCHRGWRFQQVDTVKMGKLAADSCLWPLYEVENGEHRITRKPRDKKPVSEWLKAQGRFKHLFDGRHEDMVEQIQEQVDARWNMLLSLCGDRRTEEKEGEGKDG